MKKMDSLSSCSSSLEWKQELEALYIQGFKLFLSRIAMPM